MPGSAFDTSGPPNGDYARYLERLSADSATGREAGSGDAQVASTAHQQPRRQTVGSGAPASAEHRWGYVATDNDDDERGSGLGACPGPAPGFGFDPAGHASRTSAPSASAPPPRPRRLLHVLALALILAGVAQIALAALPPEPWFSTPLPGFVLLVAGLHLRSRARRSRSRHDRTHRPDRRDPHGGPSPRT